MCMLEDMQIQRSVSVHTMQLSCEGYIGEPVDILTRIGKLWGKISRSTSVRENRFKNKMKTCVDWLPRRFTCIEE